MVTRVARLRGLPGVLALAAIVCCGTTTSAQTTLRWKFQPGQVLDQAITQETKATVSVGGQSFPNTATQVIDATWSVGQVDAQGVAQVTQQIKRIRMTIGGAITAEIDSASDATPQGLAATLSPVVKALGKARFDMRMNALGEILEVDVSQETLDALKPLSNAQQMGNLFSKESLVNMIKQGAPAMPQDPVKKGSTWSNTMEVAAAPIGKMISVTNLTYAGPVDIGGKQLEQIDMDVTTQLNAPPDAAVPVTIKDQSAKGTMYFDNQAGRMDHSELTQDMTMQITAGNNKFDQKIQTSIKVEIKPAAAKQ